METMGKPMGTNEMSGNTGRTVDQASSTAHRAIDRATEAARPAVDRMAAGAHNVVDKLAGAAATAADTLDARTGQLKDAQSRLSDACRSYVRERPMTSLGIAIGAGFLLSLLMSRR